MANLDEMRQHYENAGKNYEAASNAHDHNSRYEYQKTGDEEYGKADKIAEDAKQEVRTESCQKAKECYDKQADAMDRGDMKAAKQYQEQGDKIMAEGEKKEKEIERERSECASEARSKMNGLEMIRH